MTYELTGNHAYNVDCMELMREVPDKYFELAVCDPPYGINVNTYMGSRKRESTYQSCNPTAEWDNSPPPKTYFDELFRISKHAIIWGGNYFELPPCKCFIVWRKPDITETLSFSMLEYAWTNLEGTSKEWIGVAHIQSRAEKISPTQKPVALYTWLFAHYAKQGDKILDTHLGSGSSRIAAYELGLDFIGCEIDSEYFAKQEERFTAYTAQTSLFH